jgi:hypothetical protein
MNFTPGAIISGHSPYGSAPGSPQTLAWDVASPSVPLRRSLRRRPLRAIVMKDRQGDVLLIDQIEEFRGTGAGPLRYL